MRGYLSRPVTFILYAGIMAAIGVHYAHIYLNVLNPDKVVILKDISELSGMTYLPEQHRFIGVSDNGDVTEFDIDGNLFRKRNYPELDLEDISLAKEPGYAWVTAEETRVLLKLRLRDFEFVSQNPVNDKLFPWYSKNKQFEGVLVREDASADIILANESMPASLVFLHDPLKSKSRSTILDATSVSGVINILDKHLLAISRTNGLLLLSASGKPIGKWRLVHGHKVEGGAYVPGLGLVLCTDRKRSRLLIFTSMKSDTGIRDAFNL